MPVCPASKRLGTKKRSTTSVSAKGRARPALTAHDSVTTHGKWVKIKRGDQTIRAYVAYPERKTKAPAVIVLENLGALPKFRARKCREPAGACAHRQR